MATLLLFTTACHRKSGRTEAPDALPRVDAEVRILAVGDLIPHHDVRMAATQAGGWRPLWAELAPLLASSDLAFLNLETPVAPEHGVPGVPFVFNAPADLPEALMTSGFSVVASANNHAFDQGAKGLQETCARLKAAGITALGTGRTRVEAEQVQIIERKGIRMAFLAFTDLLNIDLNRKNAEPWVASLGLEPALESVKSARQRADVVVVSVHWGNEYQIRPSQRQRNVARALIEAGADLILGHHPHVLQPVECMASGGRKGVVAFSLGNFISNQDRTWRADQLPVPEGDNRDGAALVATFRRLRAADGSSTIQMEQIGVEPLWTENNWWERHSGQSTQTVIRTVRLGTAIEATRIELERLGLPESNPDHAEIARKRQALQERLRTLILRRERIRQVVGTDVVRTM